MENAKQRDIIRARQERKQPISAVQLITPQIFSTSVTNMTLGDEVTSFLLPLAGEIDELTVMLAYWPVEVKQIMLTAELKGPRHAIQRAVDLDEKLRFVRINETVDAPCRLSISLSDITYHEELQEGRKRLHVPTNFALVFRPISSVCQKVRG